LLAGCNLFFQSTLDEPLGPTDLVTGELIHLSATNDATGRPTPTRTPIGGLVAKVRFEGGEADVPVDGTGSFAFVRPEGGRYQLLFPITGDPFEIDTDAPSLTAVRRTVGRAGPAVQSETIIEVPGVNGTKVLASRGQYSFNVMAPTDMTLDWRSTAANGNLPVGLLDGSLGDRLLLLVYGTEVAGDSITQAIEVPPMMIDGNKVDMRTAPPSVQDNACFTVDFPDHVLTVDDFRDTLPSRADPVIEAWVVGTYPARDIGPLGRINLAGKLGPIAQSATMSFHRLAFAGHELLATIGVKSAATLTHPGAVSGVSVVLALDYETKLETAAPASTCAAPVASLTTDVGTATGISLDQQPLVVDGAQIPIPAKRDLELKWTHTRSADMFTVTLFEVTLVQIGEATGTALVPKRAITTSTPGARIDRRLLESGKHYVFQVSTFRGYPGAAAGNFEPLTYPRGQTTTFSSMFQAQ
jgi:hypothetical protein